MFCSITGQITVEPVCSKNGYIFEKSAIEKHIEIKGTCPMTNQPLTKNDLIPINLTKVTQPRTLKQTSIPQLLNQLHNEWDTFVLEYFNVKKALQQTREELARSFYEFDASSRVIARLMEEKDSLKSQLEELQSKNQVSKENQEEQNLENIMEVETNQISKEMKKELEDFSLKLAQEHRRKRRELKKKQIKPIDPKKLSLSKSTNTLFKKDKPQISTIDFFPKNSDLIIAGGIDGNCQIYDRKKESIIIKTKGDYPITSITTHPNELLFITGDKKGNENFYQIENLKQKKGFLNPIHSYNYENEIIGIQLHPDEKHLITSFKDVSWRFSDMETKTDLGIYSQKKKDFYYTTSSLHPDGLLLAEGVSNNVVEIWEIHNELIAAKFEHNLKDYEIKSVAFSNGGIHFASGSLDSSVKIWDLRYQTVLSEINLDLSNQKSKESKPFLLFDPTGTFLFIFFNNKIKIISTKNWSEFSEIKIKIENENEKNLDNFLTDAKFLSFHELALSNSKGIIEFYNQKK
ncbi:pre-mRNA-processing factor 19 [Anaeramoeba ignava]|uniref:Pre-mRNA-processing factor 19 n=1 Tax=Anaeramoeba ignava TaxID=1746090 RepID=A0A9Q0LDP9_ANAIG|nr:pre-mRNA-processing factor 19 [Anaeramoeba ignava]